MHGVWSWGRPPRGMNHVTTCVVRSSSGIAALEHGDTACRQGMPALTTSMSRVSMTRIYY